MCRVDCFWWWWWGDVCVYWGMVKVVVKLSVCCGDLGCLGSFILGLCGFFCLVFFFFMILCMFVMFVICVFLDIEFIFGLDGGVE